jgi:hypothetical protein
MIAGDDDGNVWILNESNSKNGDPLRSYALFPRFAVGDGEYKGLVHRIEPHTTKRSGSEGYSLAVALLTYDFADGYAVDFVSGEFDMSHQGLRYVPIRAAARYAEVLYRTLGPDEPWDLGGHEVKVSPLGSR